jgi:hypothetical protein
MKNYWLILFCGSILFTSCDFRRKGKIADDMDAANEKAMQQAMKDTTAVVVTDSIFNFGTIKQGALVEHNFVFKNTGNKPLVFPENPRASCGCTVPTKPEKPVFPGDTAFIKVVFNSANKMGHVTKKVTVYSNASPSFPQLVLVGDIEENK